jgi:hypothetical protein
MQLALTQGEEEEEEERKGSLGCHLVLLVMRALSSMKSLDMALRSRSCTVS